MKYLIAFYVLVALVNTGFLAAWLRIWRIERSNEYASNGWVASAISYSCLAGVLVAFSVFMVTALLFTETPQ